MKILLTGAAGFIGSKLACDLARRGDEVLGIDNINDYYDVRLKYGRLAACGIYCRENPAQARSDVSASDLPGLTGHLRFAKMDIADKAALDALFAAEHFDKVVHLAAQAGVRNSITDPYAYLQSNLAGFLNILEVCRHSGVKHLIYASSSSVYGLNDKLPYHEDDPVDRPVSLYAATKKSNELMAHSYCALYGTAMTGLRFFTVYGPWGRPDMSPMRFVSAISRGEAIEVFNRGDMIRDFTYIDDIVAGAIRCIDHTPAPNADGLPYRIYNLGGGHPVTLLDFIAEIEQAMGREAQKVFLPMQAGDIYQTHADTMQLRQEVGYSPRVCLHEGIAKLVAWYRSDKNPLK